MTKKLHIKTYGCQMNVYDSGRMADLLAPLGYSLSAAAEGADLVILNTCHIREKAAEKVYSDLGRIRTLKDDRAAAGGRMILAVAGCVAQAEGEEMLRRAPQVDMVFGPQSYHRLPEMVARVAREGGGLCETDFPVESKFDYLPEEARAPGAAAFLSVQEGCDKFCTFCVVPYTRGAEFSRPVVDIVAEAERLATGGAVEITLLGQNVNGYHGEGPDGRSWGLGRLLRRLAEIEPLSRLRYTTSHPRDMDDELIAAHGAEPKVMPYLHLPVQSGSDRILAAMNRRHSADEYRRIIDKLRQVRPDIALSSDFIAGFPGESDRDFADTIRLIADIGYAQAYSFKYSPRPGTPAALEAQLEEAVKAERLATIQQLLGEQQIAFNRAAVGQALPVLFEREGRKQGQLLGRTDYMQSVHVEVPAALHGGMMGRVVPVLIERAQTNSLAGRLTETDSAAAQAPYPPSRAEWHRSTARASA